MVFSTVAKGAGQTSATNANKPAILARHLVRDQRLVLGWTTSGLNAGPFTSDPLFPIERLYDGRLYYDSRPVAAATTHYINMRFTPAELDCAFFEVMGTTTWDVILQLSNDGAAGWTTIFTWLGVSGGQAGHARRFQINAGSYYAGVEYARLRFNGISAIPAVGEVCLGRSQQISRKFDIPYDDAPLGAEVREFVGRNRAKTRYVDARGFRDLFARATPTGSDNYGLNDVASFRSIFTESEHGTQPIVYVENPSSAPSSALFGMGALEDRMDLQGPYKRLKDWTFEEQPPFLAREA